VGRHSDPSQWPFIRSVLGWSLPWFFAAGLLGIGIWVAVDAIGNDDIQTPVSAGTGQPSSPARERPTATPSEEPAEPSVTPSPIASETPQPEVELITENMTVQVLNGTADAAADDRMANELGTLGFEVVAVQGSSVVYDLTTVFWSYAESQEAAERLAERFGWQVASKPDNLSTTVALHVVVGSDY
jgi:hypothetical protein